MSSQRLLILLICMIVLVVDRVARDNSVRHSHNVIRFALASSHYLLYSSLDLRAFLVKVNVCELGICYKEPKYL